MIRHLRSMMRRLAATDGSTTVEFALHVPVLITIVLGGIELGIIQMRHVMLERSLDLAVRDVRLGRLDPVTHDSLRDRICSYNAMMPNCQADLRLEMERLNPRALTLIGDEADCVDRADDTKPIRSTFDELDSNEMAILRACALFDPFFPTTALGASIHKVSEGAYGLLATSLFVVEPRE